MASSGILPLARAYRPVVGFSPMNANSFVTRGSF
jgi:hypothetical protein